METKKKPERTCAVCRTKGEKSCFIKVVKTVDGIKLDLSGKTNGRSVYICKNKKCIDEAIKRRVINRAFKRECPEEIYKELGKINECN